MSVPKKNKKGEEMTRYAFISHMEDYMKKLLTDPQKAEPDDFLKSFGLDGPVCLDILLKRNGDNDPESAIILRKERIVKGEPDDNGKPGKDSFAIKYTVPRKNYTRKMRNAYIGLFEDYRCSNKLIEENMDKTIPDYSSILNEINANRLPELSKISIEKKGNKVKFIFGKNMWGLTDELGKISKEIKKLSKTNNVYLVDSNLDPLDDVYDLTVRLDPIDKKEEEIENKVVKNSNKYILGLDVSKWNGTIDWKAVKKAGIQFVIIRAGYGTGYVDPYFKRNIEAAIENNLLIGVYWFSYSHTFQGAKLEAEKCIKTISPYKEHITLPVFWDFEYDSVNYAKKNGHYISKNLASGMADTFCTTINSKGFRAGIYTNIDYSNRYFLKDVLAKYHTWIA